MLKNYLKVALRNLLRQRTYSFINVFGLGIGLACCVLIVLFIQHEWSYDRFHENRDRIYRVNTIRKEPGGAYDKNARQPVPMRDALLQEFAEVEYAVRFINMSRVIVQYREKTFGETIHYGDEGLFQMFTFPLVAGDAETAFESPNAIVISQTVARKYFGEDDPLGQIFSLTISEARYHHTVTAVMADIPENSSVRFDFVIPIRGYPNYDSPHFFNNWNSSRLCLFVQLREGAPPAELEAKFPPFVNKHLGAHIAVGRKDGTLSQDKDAWQIGLQPLLDIHLNPWIRWGMEETTDPRHLHILLGIAFLVLLIASINFMTLAIGRSAGRAREVGVRQVLGAMRSQLMKQFWSEALLLALLSLLLAVMLAELFLPAFNDLIGRNLTIDFAAHLNNWLVLVGLLALVALMAGFYPALVLSRFRPVEVLKAQKLVNRIGGYRGGLRKALVVAQYTLSILFIICTIIMFEQMDFIRNKDLGFNQEMVVAIPTYSRDLESVQLLNRFRQALQPYPEVVSISGGTFSFNRGWSLVGWAADGKQVNAYEVRVDANYLATMQMTLREGRFFSPEISSDVDDAVVVNERLVKEFGLSYPVVGRPLEGWGAGVSGNKADPIIVGVARDYHFNSLREAIYPMVLHMTPDWPIRYILVRLSPEDVAGTLSLLEAAWQNAHPNAPFEYSFIDDDIERQYSAELRWGKILTYSSVFAILIASMGLFGLALLSATQRTKEIGIRKVLGATVGGIVGLLSQDFVKLVAVANLIAWPVAWIGMSRWLQGFAYRIDLSWSMFVSAGALAVLIALLTVGALAVKAALANPVESLRYE